MSQAWERVTDVSAREALEQLRRGDAVMVDVRTRAEWTFVGVADLAGVCADPVFVEWQQYPSMAVDPAFPALVAGKLAERDAPTTAALLFLCRSGVRSRAAAQAMAEMGYPRCFNIAGGFEGPPDGERRRGRLEGWKAEGLPWVQS